MYEHKTDRILKLPNNDGQFVPANNWNKIPSRTITVPSFSTQTVTVVGSVKIALDILTDGNYTTIDSGPACNFFISGGGTVTTNLIQV